VSEKLAGRDIDIAALPDLKGERVDELKDLYVDVDSKNGEKVRIFDVRELFGYRLIHDGVNVTRPCQDFSSWGGTHQARDHSLNQPNRLVRYSLKLKQLELFDICQTIEIRSRCIP
jgi:hypothetical protein